MMTKFFKYNLLLSLIVFSNSPALSTQQLQLMMEGPCQKTLNVQYQKLFWDQWHRLTVEGQYQEAKDQATSDEEKHMRAQWGVNGPTYNYALSAFKYRQAQVRKALVAEDGYEEVVTQESLIIRKSPAELIDELKQGIQRLKEARRNRETSIERDLEALESGPLLKEKYEQNVQKSKESISFRIGNIGRILKTNFPATYQACRVDHSPENIEKCVLGIQIESREQEDAMHSLETGISFIKFLQRNIEENQRNIETQGHLRMEPNAQKDLEERIAADEAHKQDTHARIGKIKSKIKFIKDNPSFFEPTSLPLSQLHGTEDLVDWLLESKSELGWRIPVAVLDIWPDVFADIQTRLKAKITNADSFRAKPFTSRNIEAESNNNHGFHVAGIIASPCLDPQQPSEYTQQQGDYIGVAPGSNLEIYNHDALRPPKGMHFNLVEAERVFSAEDHAFLMDMDLSGEKENNPWYVSSQYFGRCFGPDERLPSIPILSSQAQVLNRSMVDTGTTRFARQALTQLEVDADQLFALRMLADQGKLIVNSAGNNGIYLSSTQQYRLIKAMAYSKKVAPSYILVGNVMQDGLTIHSTSNQPGDDLRLQARFLMASGTNILSHAPLENMNKADCMKTMTGTSMATPFVSGAAAIVMQRFPTLHASAVATCLLNGAVPILVTEDGDPYELKNVLSGSVMKQHPELEGDILRGRAKYGMGRLNVENALDYAEVLSKLL